MAFHHDFWVAIAAAAPIIGLASIVNVDHTVRRSEREIRRAHKENTDQPPIPNAAYWTSYINIVLQAFALALALYCLGTFQDHIAWGRQIAGVMAVVGMVLVLAPPWWATTRIYGQSMAAHMWTGLKAKWAKPKAGQAGGDGDQLQSSDDSSQAS
jgi:hypothetical protein